MWINGKEIITRAEEITKEELEKKLIELYEGKESKVDKTQDLWLHWVIKRVLFEVDEDLPDTDNECMEEKGFYTENGVTIFEVITGGDCFFPYYAAIYWNGKELRAYAPRIGNWWNTDTLKAYGGCPEKDFANLRDRNEDFGNWIGSQDAVEFQKEYDTINPFTDPNLACDFQHFFDYDIESCRRMTFSVLTQAPKHDEINMRLHVRPSWDEYYAGMCEYVTQRSLDPNTQVGCIVVDENNRPKSFGYNSFPAGCRDEELPHTRPEKYPYMVHAEANALDNYPDDLTGCTLYVPFFPCPDCFKRILNRNIACVKYYERYESGVNQDDAVRIMAQHKGVKLINIANQVSDFVDGVKKMIKKQENRRNDRS